MTSNRQALRAAAVLSVMAIGSAAPAEDAMTTQTRTGTAYEGEHLALADHPAPLYSVAFTTEKGAGVDRVRTVNTDRSGHPFFTQTVDFDGDSPEAYTFSNLAAKQEGKLTVTPKELIMEFTEGSKTRTARESRPARFAVGPSISRIVE